MSTIPHGTQVVNINIIYSVDGLGRQREHGLIKNVCHGKLATRKSRWMIERERGDSSEWKKCVEERKKERKRDKCQWSARKRPKEIRDTVTCCNTNCTIAGNSFSSINGCDARACQRDSPPWHMSSAHSFISGYNNNKITSHALTTMTCVFFIPNSGLQALGIVEKGLDEQTC